MFEPLDLSHRDIYTSYAARKPCRSYEGSFACTYIWRHKFSNDLFYTDNAMYVRGFTNERRFIVPIGVKDWTKAVEECTIADPGAALGDLAADDAAGLDAAFPGRYNFSPRRERADYIYLQSDLANLPGKKYHQKRNFCARFEREYEGRYAFEELSGHNLKNVLEFQEVWRRGNGHDTVTSLQEENTAIKCLLCNMEELRVSGLVLSVDGKVAGFTAGSAISNETFDVSVEKADYELVGAYPMLCRELSRHCGSYKYMNREEDLGVENLRKSKLSYHPHMLIEKFAPVPVSGE